MKKTYNELKNEALIKALEWQEKFKMPNDWYCTKEYRKYFYKQAKRYGLLKEFRENGII